MVILAAVTGRGGTVFAGPGGLYLALDLGLACRMSAMRGLADRNGVAIRSGRLATGLGNAMLTVGMRDARPRGWPRLGDRLNLSIGGCMPPSVTTARALPPALTLSYGFGIKPVGSSNR